MSLRRTAQLPLPPGNGGTREITEASTAWRNKASLKGFSMGTFTQVSLLLAEGTSGDCDDDEG